MSEFKFEAWPTEYRHINQFFGANPQYYGQFGLPGHEGVDIMAPAGSKVFAVAPGRISKVYDNPEGHNYGRHVRIEHQDGYRTIYAHLEAISVALEQQVKAGEQLGLANDSGNSFGSHLHLTLKQTGTTQDNWPHNIIDPTPFLMSLLGWQTPAGPYTEGWAYTSGLVTTGNLAQVNAGGVNLRQTPSVYGRKIDLVPGGTIIIITGPERNSYTPVKVATAALPNGQVEPPKPAPPPPPTASTVDGWAWQNYLTIRFNQAVVGQYGINLRAAPSRTAHKIGLVQGGSTVTVLGAASADYLPVRARRQDFLGDIELPSERPGVPAPPSLDETIVAWAWTRGLTIVDREGTAGRYGLNLRHKASRLGDRVGLLIGEAKVKIVGLASGEYTPVEARKVDIRSLASPLPTIEAHQPFPGEKVPDDKPTPVETTPGWVFTAHLAVQGNAGVAGPYGLNLRDAPRRDARKLAFIPADVTMVVTGSPQGEYTPVRVANDVLKDVIVSGEPPEPKVFGNALIGLHASADPEISKAEVAEFAETRPGVIKLLSFHNPKGVAKLVAAHPDAKWIVRAFLSFGGRNISPDQFLRDTISDVRRTLDLLKGKESVVELHNEPNIVPEGLGTSWSDGAGFSRWWLTLLELYQRALPGTQFIYPGLSPGHQVSGIKQDHIRFLEASRAAVDAADGLGVHLYWSRFYPMSRALDVLDDYISRVRSKPIWITEASNNKGGVSPSDKGREYLTFWRELQKRPTVQGVTYFVASASNPDFVDEVWVGRRIGRVVGRR